MRLAAVVGCLVVLAAIGGCLGAGPEEPAGPPAEERFVVELAADGTATVSVTYLLDLGDTEDRERFETLRDDEDAREAAAAEFRGWMTAVADDVTAETGREMRVTDATVSVAHNESESAGVLTYHVTWTNFAVEDDGALVVREPFSLGYDLDRPLVVVAPEGYAVTSAAPEPAARSDQRVSWPGYTEFFEFEVVIEPVE